ncbi:MAG: hypothetical protein K6E91_07535 [Butyrivibrio sp.]|nr:hypothetical protein [Butyrivibrio sp.]
MKKLSPRSLLGLLMAVMLLASSVNVASYAASGSENSETDEGEKEEKDDDEEEKDEDDIAEWTVMGYICGTDLESEGGLATINFEEIANTIPNDSVNVVLQTGGTKAWHTEELGLTLDPKKSNRISYGEDGFTLLEEMPLQNMASGQTLSDFISWATEEYPAKKYMLVMWDHGGGSQVGLIVDEFYNHACMSLTDFERALKRADVQLEAVACDCCLMATIDMALAAKDYCNYLIASEEIEPGRGTDWNAWLQYIYDVPRCSGEEVGVAVCDTAQVKYIELNDDMSTTILTQSVVDLSKMDDVSEAFDNYFKKLAEVVKSPEDFRRYMQLINYAEGYGGGRYGMIDIADMAEKARRCDLISEEAIELQRSVKDAVSYNIRGRGRSHAHGLSYYDGLGASERELDHYARTAKSAYYLAYLDAVHNNWTAPDWVYEVTDPIGDLTYDDYGVDVDVALTENGNLELDILDGMGAVVQIDAKLYKMGEDGIYEDMGYCTDIHVIDEEKGIFESSFNGRWPAIDGVFAYMDIDDENLAYTRYNTSCVIESVDEKKYQGEDDPELLIGEVMSITSAFMPIAAGDAPEDESTSEEGEEAKEEETDSEPAEDEHQGIYEVYGLAKQSYFNENTSLPDRGTFSLKDFEGITVRLLYPKTDELTGAMIFGKGDTLEISRNLSMENQKLPAGEYGYSFVIKDVVGNSTETDIIELNWDGSKAEYVLPEAE